MNDLLQLPPDVPTSNEELIAKLRKHKIKAKFVPYEKLRYVDRLEDITPCILLYQQHHLIGHWAAIWRTKKGLKYFDSTGKVPDELNKTSFDNPKGRKAMGASFTYLTRLLFKDLEEHEEVALDYNDVRLQPQGTNSCGPWVVVRLWCGKLSNDEFAEVFKDLSPEEREIKIRKLYAKM